MTLPINLTQKFVWFWIGDQSERKYLCEYLVFDIHNKMFFLRSDSYRKRSVFNNANI